MLREAVVSGYMSGQAGGVRTHGMHVRTEVPPCQHLLHDGRQRVVHVTGDVASGGPGIGNQLFLVEALGNVARLSRREPVKA